MGSIIIQIYEFKYTNIVLIVLFNNAKVHTPSNYYLFIDILYCLVLELVLLVIDN